jgi:hypothetical protein
MTNVWKKEDYDMAAAEIKKCYSDLSNGIVCGTSECAARAVLDGLAPPSLTAEEVDMILSMEEDIKAQWATPNPMELIKLIKAKFPTQFPRERTPSELAQDVLDFHGTDAGIQALAKLVALAERDVWG